MQTTEFRLPTTYPGDSSSIFVRSFLPEESRPGGLRAVVQLAHGMAEHSARYARFAQALTGHGYGVYVNDHRGHGHTVTRREDLGHFADENGWEKVVTDQLALLAEIQSRHPDSRVFLMGHSMGSYIARSTALRGAHMLAGLILSGTSHDTPIAMKGARAVAAVERLRLGPRGKSALLRKLTFDAFNAKIDDPRTTCDWLSRDPFEVDKYLADPLCGFECSTQLFHDMFGGMAEIFSPAELKRLPKQLPIYIMAGELDPLNNRLAAIKKLHKALELAGLTDITLRVYPGSRHELLNETNRDEATRDVLEWLDAHSSGDGLV
jgi:alpha-beta hydrolase superfamily lysophospholipase